MIAPGQPGLRVNATPDEVIKYSPRKIDVINLESNSFETIELDKFLRESAYEIPGINKIVSIYEENHLRVPSGLNLDPEEDTLVATFDGLFSGSSFVKQIKVILDILKEAMGIPVDIEFASDGNDFYLLQCRPQSYGTHNTPSPIPKDIPKDKIIFSACKYISNGFIPNISHIVYVDPQAYSELESRSEMNEIGIAVSHLNKVLPKRQFILMGPGRWGSRGDIKLGVNVTYSDINNTAVLIEIARKKGNYSPDLSFGTHFFQDLVEANIRYIPLYPDDENIIFNELFLKETPNILPEVLPEYASLADTIRLIDVPQATDGLILKVLMNSDLDEAVGILAEPSNEVDLSAPESITPTRRDATFWRWRMMMVENIASEIDPDRLGVVNLYVFGSTKNANAGPTSDIDILVHFRGTEKQRECLINWLEGWSLCLAQINYMRTGYRINNLLDVHIITDKDIADKTSLASKIGAVTDPAQLLPLGKVAKD
ncbi:MAG: hypothetical protein DRP47_05655 [Candidatus Zixiibacteriota bacterium]|nr:MAG: hypothetical protein DRP47_05655 [candidate division Zixibacteria bacterium]